MIWIVEPRMNKSILTHNLQYKLWPRQTAEKLYTRVSVSRITWYTSEQIHAKLKSIPENKSDDLRANSQAIFSDFLHFAAFLEKVYSCLHRVWNFLSGPSERLRF